MTHIFISYSHQDREFARKLVEELRKKNFNVWIDENIQPGDRWTKEVVNALISSAAIIVIMTIEAEQSEWVEREILLAHKYQKPIFPLLLHGKVFPLLIDRQYETVEHGKLPSDKFFNRLAESMKLIDVTNDQSTPKFLNNTPIIITELHRQADLRLLNELWIYLNTKRLASIAAQIHATKVNFDQFSNYILHYCYLRQEFPEKHFIDIDLETACQKIDTALTQLGDRVDDAFEWIDNHNDGGVLRASYKLPQLDREYPPLSTEEYQQLVKKLEQAINCANDVLRIQSEFIKVIQLKLPEFSFPDVM